MRSGKEVWSSANGVFGTCLSYSEDADIIIKAGRSNRDTLSDEPKGMRAYRGAGGERLWFQPSYGGPAMIHGDLVLHDSGACSCTVKRLVPAATADGTRPSGLLAGATALAAAATAATD